MTYIRLFFEFFKVGLFSVGGGLSTLPFLYNLSSKTGWFTHSQLADMIAISESTPGPIGVNMATYAGYIVADVSGAIVATLGLICPEIIVILIICRAYKKFRNNKYVDAAFYGLRICSVALIASAGILVVKVAFFPNNNISIKALILGIILIILTRFVPKIKELHPIYFIVFSAVIGIIFKF